MLVSIAYLLRTLSVDAVSAIVHCATWLNSLVDN